MPNFQDQELWKRNGKSYRIIVKQSLQRSIKTTDTTHDPPKELSFGALVGVVAGLLVESVAVSLVCLFFDGEIRIVLVGLVVGLVVAVHVQQVLSNQFSSTLFRDTKSFLSSSSSSLSSSSFFFSVDWVLIGH